MVCGRRFNAKMVICFIGLCLMFGDMYASVGFKTMKLSGPAFVVGGLAASAVSFFEQARPFGGYRKRCKLAYGGLLSSAFGAALCFGRAVASKSLDSFVAHVALAGVGTAVTVCATRDSWDDFKRVSLVKNARRFAYGGLGVMGLSTIAHVTLLGSKIGLSNLVRHYYKAFRG